MLISSSNFIAIDLVFLKMSRRTNCKQISKFFYQTEDVWKYLMQMIFKWKSPKLSLFVSFTLCTISPLAALDKITFTHKQILQKRIFKSIITIHYGSCYSRISIHYRMHVLWLRVWNSIVCLKDFSYCYWQNLENCFCIRMTLLHIQLSSKWMSMLYNNLMLE